MKFYLCLAHEGGAAIPDTSILAHLSSGTDLAGVQLEPVEIQMCRYSVDTN